jgi:hypothetical protein
MAAVSLFDFRDVFAPPVAIAVPRGTCRTDAPAVAEAPEFSASAEPDLEDAASVCKPVAGDVPVDSVVVDVPSGSDESVPDVPAASVDPPELADPVPSAQATPCGAAIATPTPNATANAPIRPM